MPATNWTDADDAAVLDDSLWPSCMGWPDESREAVLDWRRRFRAVARRRQTIIARWERRAAVRGAPDDRVTTSKFTAAVSNVPRHQVLLYAEAMLTVVSNAYDWLKIFEELSQEFDHLAGGNLPPVVGAPVNLVADAAAGVLLLAEMSETFEKNLKPEE